MGLFPKCGGGVGWVNRSDEGRGSGVFPNPKGTQWNPQANTVACSRPVPPPPRAQCHRATRFGYYAGPTKYNGVFWCHVMGVFWGGVRGDVLNLGVYIPRCKILPKKVFRSSNSEASCSTISHNLGGGRGEAYHFPIIGSRQDSMNYSISTYHIQL